MNNLSIYEYLKQAAFRDAPVLSTIRIGKPKDAIPGAPWGAPTSYGVPNATIIWEG